MRYLLLLVAMLSAEPSLPLSKIISENVSIGGMSAKTLGNSPNVVYITQEDIRLSGAQNLSELLEIYVPSFEYSYNRWNGVIWGMSGSMPDQNDKIAVFYNGIPANQMSNLGYKLEASSLAALETILRIEVYIGPIGQIYGPGAVAGAINIITKPYREYQSTFSAKSTMLNNGSTGRSLSGGFANKIEGFRVYSYVSAAESPGNGNGSTRMLGRSELIPYNVGKFGKLPEGGTPTSGSFGKSPLDLSLGTDAESNRAQMGFRVTRSSEDLSAFYMANPWGGRSDTASVMYGGKLYSRKGTEPYLLWSNRVEMISTGLLAYAMYERPLGIPVTIGGSVVSLDTRMQNDANDNYSRGNGDLLKNYGETQYRAYILSHYRIGERDYNMNVSMLHNDIGRSLWGTNIVGDATTNWIPDSRLQGIPVMDLNNIGITMNTSGPLIKSIQYEFGFRIDQYNILTEPLHSDNLAITYRNDESAISVGTNLSSKTPSAEAYGIVRDTSGLDFRRRARYSLPIDSTSQILYPVTQSMRDSLTAEYSRSFYLNYQSLFGGYLVRTGVTYTDYKNMLGWDPLQKIVRNAYSYQAASLSGSVQYKSGCINSGGSMVWQFPLHVNREDIVTKVPKYRPAQVGLDASTGLPVYIPVDQNEDTTLVFDNPSVMTISQDGKNYTNVHPVIGKMWFGITYADFNFMVNARVFSAMLGRQYGIDAGDIWVFSTPQIKLNSSLTWNYGNWSTSLSAYNILGGFDANAIRFQQSVAEQQQDVYLVDRPAIAITVRREL